MATPAPVSPTSVPTIERVNARLAFVPSSAGDGRYYRTSPDHCTCASWTHRHHGTPDFRCKHVRRAFPRFCGNCGTERVSRAGDVCAHCAAQLAEAQQFCGCGRGRRPLEPFSVCALCIAEEAGLMDAHITDAERHAVAMRHAPLRLVR